MNMIKYRCEKCGKEQTTVAKAANPECCGGQMRQMPLGLCATPHDAETYRASNADAPCRDGTR